MPAEEVVVGVETVVVALVATAVEGKGVDVLTMEGAACLALRLGDRARSTRRLLWNLSVWFM